jgi:hypothetical protein
VHAFLISPVIATWATHHSILDFTIQTILGDISRYAVTWTAHLIHPSLVQILFWELCIETFVIYVLSSETMSRTHRHL